MQILRRDFLRGAAILTAGATLTVARRSTGQDGQDAGFGPLQPDPEGNLELPEGFSYRILQTRGDRMTDLQVAPDLPDGMACFEAEDGNWVLMRNHERGEGTNPQPEVAFDPEALGGVTRLVLNPESLDVISSNQVLVGTLRNCAGGPSPWGWLSCEETDFEDAGHGFVFRCDPEASEAQAAEPIEAYGRFKHEAVAVDPRRLVAYLTEDQGDSCFYRFVPDNEREPFVGTLQALAVVGNDLFDTSPDLEVGDALEVRWIDVPDPSAATERTATQAQALGAAVFARGEGCWWSEEERAVYFTCTTGGPVNGGQVFRLDPTTDGGTLTLVAQSQGDGALVSPDNLTVSPWGDLIVCEDSLLGNNHLRGITPEGTLYDLARNVRSGGISEFAGVCFSPDGKVLFVNLQLPGLTLAITGPFPDPPRRGCFG